MTITKVNPDVVHPPAGNYSHVAIVPAGHRIFYLAGQLGMHKDGTVPESVEDQFEQALQNILQIVMSEGGSAEDVAKLTFFYAEEPTDRSRHGKALRAMFGDRRPAMTFIRVVGLADPKYKVEVEAIAAVRDRC